MRDHYEKQDKLRLSAKESAVLSVMLDRGWMTLGDVGKDTGIQQGTVASRIRDMKARGVIDYERKRVQGGLHVYKVWEVETGQISLPLEEAHAR